MHCKMQGSQGEVRQGLYALTLSIATGIGILSALLYRGLDSSDES